MQTKKFNPNLLLAALFCAWSISLTAQPPELDAEPIGPTTTVEFAEPEFDFGQINSGEVVTKVFTFKNTGDKPLMLSNARGSCGCTVPQWPKDPIQPGETASITVEFNSKGKKGHQMKKVTLTANTEPPQSFLYMKGEVLVQDEGDQPAIIVQEEPAAKIRADCFAIYPNPTAEHLKLKIQESHIGQSATVSILSQGGQLMAEREIEELRNEVDFDVSHYPPGTYIAHVQIGEGAPDTQCFVVVK